MAGPNDPSLPSPNQPKYPATVRAAGIIWIVFGSAIILSMILLLARNFGVELEGVSERAGPVGAIVQGLIQGVIGGFFLYEGIASCRGTVPSTVGIAVGSFLFALIYVALAVFQAEARQGYNLVLVLIIVAGLVAAGVLALAGRTDYDNWRAAPVRPRQK